MTVAKRVLTDAYLRGLDLVPAGNRYDVWDEGNTGLGVRVSGVISWCYMYRHEGKLRRLTLGKFPAMTCRDARLAYAKAAQAVAEGRDPAAAKLAKRVEDQKALTVERLCDQYIERYAKPRKRSWAEDERQLNKDVIPTLGKRLARDIQRKDLVGLLDRKVDAGAGVASNRLLALLRRLFAWAVERGELDESPADGISRQYKEKSRERVLGFEEVQFLWAALESRDWTRITKPVRDALRVMLVTGQRSGEVLSMRWEHLTKEDDGWWWTIAAGVAKNGKAHRVPLDNLAMEVIGTPSPEEQRTGPVFASMRKPGEAVIKTSTSHALRDEFKTGRSMAAQVPFTPHDLRRTVATALSCLGYQRLIVMKVLNHSDPSVSAVYDRYSYDKEKREALGRWAEMLYETQDTRTGRDPDTGERVELSDFAGEWRRMAM